MTLRATLRHGFAPLYATPCDMRTIWAFVVPNPCPPKTILKRLKKMEADIASDLEELEAMLG